MKFCAKMSRNEYDIIDIRQPPSHRIPLAFWCLGLMNNASYVIMLAAAKDISEGGTALVFIANIVPSLAIKLSAPYWFDKVSYHTRILASAALMGTSFLVVATFTTPNGTNPTFMHVSLQLVGVALASAQCGLGEASLLALAGLCDSARNTKNCITCFSSGTGLAGVFGFLWKYVWDEWLGFTLKQTLWMAMILVAIYAMVYVKNLWTVDVIKPPIRRDEGLELVLEEQDGIMKESSVEQDDKDDSIESDIGEQEPVQRVEDMTSLERLRLVLSLYPYMIPLFLVYAAEYTLQSGTWSAIGFPVTNLKARDEFFEYSNWMYQAGVFLSRSSGTLFTAPLYILWIMPVLQCINVVFFWVVAAQHIFYSYWLLVPCFYVGLLGGAVYVNGYLRICADLPVEYREFSLSATSVAEGVGVLVADLVGLFLQSCLYERNGLDGAVVSCPI
jgi:battenin